MSSFKNIVIVGGGMLGGSAVARALSAKLPASTNANITLINPLPYTVSLPTLPRMTVSDGNDLAETALIPFDRLFAAGSKGAFVKGVVEGIHPNRGEGQQSRGGSVVLADGQEFPYDVLVLAPGSVWEGPIDFPLDEQEVNGFLAEQRARFKKAGKIVLVGGGAVGAEFAGEIKDVWPDKEVTIVHGDTGGLLNSAYPVRFRTSLAKSLEARGVNILLGDYVDEIPLADAAITSAKTRKGSVIEADLVVPTRGPRPRTEFVAKSLGASVLDERKQIKVQPTLQLLQHPDIFAVGDAIDTAEQKQAIKAGAHSAIVVANIIAYLDDPKRPLKAYKPSTRESIVVTNGKGGGRSYIALLWGFVLGDWFTRLIKAKTLLVSKAREYMGYN
ncbi:FAD/NAD-P-binding domain-containing protein [Mycena metata]|uniref:FAD/NAD-P-binding domain-containing protein n=1 Tax=Mycena metata TaxID=1033252 RepID=A0AAD7KHJ6_9AGAR|nr:FAD/NAD-P-binding domain-containing protein [Mycena metata]